jgi:hypothetical protein
MFPRFFGAGLLDDQSFIIHVKSVRTGSGPRGQGHLHAGDRGRPGQRTNRVAGVADVMRSCNQHDC